MPYITQEQRKVLDPIIDQFPDLDDGELNYTVTRISHRFIQVHKLRYATLARVIGGLICVVFELYRRVASHYEDMKIRENGCISELDDDSHERIR